MTVLVIGTKRHLINPLSKACDKYCDTLILEAPSDTEVYFDDVKLSDVKPLTLKQLIQKSTTNVEHI